LRRRAANPDLPAREALGGRVAGSRERAVTFFAADPARVVELRGGGLSLRDVQRAGEQLGDVAALVAARDSERYPELSERFRRRWNRAAPIAGYWLLADPAAAVVLAEQQRAEEREPVFDSGRSRPGRRRRTTGRAA
jgi:hypothetical protein